MSRLAPFNSLRPHLIAPILALTLALVSPATAQGGRELLRLGGDAVLQPQASPSCSAGLRYDDNSFEGTYSFPGFGTTDLVSLFDLPAGPNTLDQVCVCLSRTGSDNSADFDLLLYAPDGAGSQPGSFLTGVGGLRANAIPAFPQTAFYNVDVSSLGIAVPGSQVYLGIGINSDSEAGVHLCGDETGAVPRPAFLSPDEGTSWSRIDGLRPELRALGLRADLAGGSSGCQDDENTLCLNGERFEVSVDFSAPNGNSGPATVVADTGTDDSGLFWFFEADNWEMLIKVLDGCNINNRYWVYFAATTDVAYTLTVRDTQTNQVKTYTNPQGRKAPAETDSNAFRTCP